MPPCATRIRLFFLVVAPELVAAREENKAQSVFFVKAYDAWTGVEY
jgi:hypothetical protein